MAQPEPDIHLNSHPHLPRPEHIDQAGWSQESLDKQPPYLTPDHGAGSPDIATEVKEHVTPDELFGPMSPRRGHGYKDEMANNEEYEGNGDEFRNADRNLSSSGNNRETFLTANSRNETSDRDAMANKDSPYTNKSVETDHLGSRANRHSNTGPTNSPASFKVSSMAVNRENVDKIRSRLHRDHNSPNGFTSRSSYLHANIFDDNLYISDSKLDNTLQRLFTRNSHLIGHSADFSNPMESHNFSYSGFIGLEPVIWRVHPMNAAHKETLDREMDFILFHVKPREIIGRLHKDGILTSHDYNQLTRTAAQGDRAVTRLLIRTLQRRGAKAYPALMNALLASDHDLVCERLSESEHQLKSGLLTDRSGWDWGYMKGGLHTTPSSSHTSNMGRSPEYTFNWPAFAHPTLLSSNQNFPANETWPQTNQRSPIDLVNPLYHTVPANHILATEGRDSQSLGVLRLEQRLNSVDRNLRTMHQDIASLIADSRAQENSRTMARDTDTYNSTNNPLKHTINLGHHEVIQEYLQQQMNDLKGKLKRVHEDIRALKAKDSVREFSSPNQSHYGNLREAPSGRRVIDAAVMDSHLGSLRSEIKLLHDDITALKMERSFSVHTDRTPNSTSRAFGNSTSKLHLDDSYLSPSRKSQPGDSGRGKSDASYAASKSGPWSHTAFPRYPSRYSPQFVYTGQYPDTARSVSRADSVTRSSRNKTKAGDHRPVAKSREASFNISRSPAKKEENKRPQETSDRSRPQDDDMFNNSIDDRHKTLNDGRLFADNYRSDEDVRASEPSEKDVLSKDRSDYILSPVENKDNVIHTNNSNNTYSKKSDDSLFQELDKDAFNSDDDTSRHRSKSRLGNNESRMPDQEEYQRYPDDNHSNATPQTDTTNKTAQLNNDAHHTDGRTMSPVPTFVDTEQRHSPYSTHVPEAADDNSSNATPQTDTRSKIPQLNNDAHYTDGRTATSPVPTSVDTERRRNPYSTRAPETVTPEKSPPLASDPRFGNDSSRNTPNSNHAPKQKKRVHYSDTSSWDDNRKTRDNDERPKSRAANPAYNKTDSKAPARFREDGAGTSRRPTSPADSQSSADSEFVHLTTPTRILSPPHGVPFDRVTTPYKILRNPNSRKMTTWSRKTDRQRNVHRKTKV